MAVAAVILGCGVTPVRHSSALLRKGADLSFALFITHLVTATIWYGGVHAFNAHHSLPVVARWSLWLAGFPFAIMAAMAFDRWCDAPVQALLNRQLGRTRQALRFA